MTARPDRHVGIDLLRVGAGAGLLMAHSAFWLSPLGWPVVTWQIVACAGVEAFLVSLGFLLGEAVLAGRRPAGMALLLDRGLRLWPLYAVAVGVNLAFVGMLGLPFPAVWSYLAMVQNLAWPHPSFFPEAWIVAAAMAASAMVAMGLIGLRREQPVGGGRLLWIGLLIAMCHAPRAVAAFGASTDWDLAVRKISVLRLDAALYGLLAAVLMHRRPVPPAVRCGAALLGVALLASAVILLAHDALSASAWARLFWFTLVGMGFALTLPALCCVETGAATARRLAVLASLAFVGLLSHMTLLRVGLWLGLPMQATTPMAGVALQSAYVAIAVSVAWLLWRGLDAPLRRRLRAKPAAEGRPPVAER